MDRNLMILDENGPKFRLPRIEVTGKATLQQTPTIGQTQAQIEGWGQTREDAWEEFQRNLNALRELLGSSGVVGNAVPTETPVEVNKGPRAVTEFSVHDTVIITFEPDAFGEVVAALVKCDVAFSTPQFKFESQPEVTPALLTAAADQARINASAIAAGVGATLGRLVAINVGSPRMRSMWKPYYSYNKSLHMPSNALEIRSLEINQEQLETYDTVAEVTVTYEIIEATIEAQGVA